MIRITMASLLSRVARVKGLLQLRSVYRHASAAHHSVAVVILG